MQTLISYSWLGNVRELENFTEKYMSLHDIPQHEAIISSSLSPATEQDGESKDALAGSLNEITARAINTVFKKEDGNISRTAERLQVDRNTVKR
ncbi:MAG: hypothetical protein JXQ81_05965 [Desulfuromonadales bacterium]|nr:hypothetical protein [Desulfuromonadales bacterium]MBN2792037.1 hypothetical protein [Desulfuromonadales bacterium]